MAITIKYFEPLTDAELNQFGRYEGDESDPDIVALKDNYRRLRDHHIEETKALWAELEKLKPGIGARNKGRGTPS